MRIKPTRRQLLNLAGFVFGRTWGEVFRGVVNVGLVVAVAALALQVRTLSRSPNPAEWNFYTAEANDHLYARPDVRNPIPGRVVAHAGGEFQGCTYTNSIEALDANYARGHRLFEMDFAWTADGELAAMHDWKRYRGPCAGHVPTLVEFTSQTGQPFTPTTLAMVYNWLEHHADAFLVTDIKDRSLAALAKIRMERPQLVPRIIPQIYLFKDYDLARSQGYRHIILTLYRCLSSTPDEEIVAFARRHPLFAVTMPVERCRAGGLAAALRGEGTAVYAHTVNDPAVFEALLASGAQGVYTDRFAPVDAAVLNAARPGQLR